MLEIDLHSGIRIDKVYANKYDIRGKKLIIHGGDLAAGERRRYQIRLQPPNLRSGSHRMGKVHLSYTPPGTDRLVYAQQNFKLTYKNNIAGLNTLKDHKVSERSLVFSSRYALEDAAKAVDAGKTGEARKIISRARKKLQGKTSISNSPVLLQPFSLGFRITDSVKSPPLEQFDQEKRRPEQPGLPPATRLFRV